jgi:hypothetical protein
VAFTVRSGSLTSLKPSSKSGEMGAVQGTRAGAFSG